MVTTVNVHEAKSTLSRLLERVESGERVVIARAGKPVADLVPHRRVDLVFGTAKGEIVYDPDAFDEPDEQLIADFEGR
jgi:prevent-host-death family protein